MNRSAPLLLAVLLAFSPGCGNTPVGYIEPTGKSLSGEPAWSPDGVRIAYTHYAQHGGEPRVQVWVGSVDDPGEFLVEGSSPAWSPDGSHLAYTGQGHIWAIDLATHSQLQVTPTGPFYDPSWSPDGQFIAYWVGPTSEVPYDSAGIWMVNLLSMSRKQLLRYPAGQPAWAPSGGRLAVVASIGSTAPYDEIVLIDTLQGNPVRLTENEIGNRHPAWLPDGRRLIWTNDVKTLSSAAEVWSMAPDGSNKRRVVRKAAAASCSPDGKRIVYSGWTESTGTGGLWIANIDGSGARALGW